MSWSRSLGFLALSGQLSLLGACSALVDGALNDPTPADSPCDGLDDGTPCVRPGIDAPLVCVSGRCSNSRCGDGVLDRRPKIDGAVEACDDGNAIGGDGCEADCSVSARCAGPADCVIGALAECYEPTCIDGACSVQPSPEGTPCSTGLCAGGICVSSGCGNGMLDPGETCDDGNQLFGDGCQPGCQPDCVERTQCPQNVCYGFYACRVTTDSRGTLGSCVLETPPLECGDPSCSFCDPTYEACGPAPGTDLDRDGVASCGGDCNDMDPYIFPGRIEECDGVDSNCDPSDEPAESTYYADCDGDGYAALGAASLRSCGPPLFIPGPCPFWTVQRPEVAADCQDNDSNVFPGQTTYFRGAYATPSGASSFDYDCDGEETSLNPAAREPLRASCEGGCGGMRSFPPVFDIDVECGEEGTLYGCVSSRLGCQRTPRPGFSTRVCR
jgi:cysteine-rich repeat protein